MVEKLDVGFQKVTFPSLKSFAFHLLKPVRQVSISKHPRKSHIVIVTSYVFEAQVGEKVFLKVDCSFRKVIFSEVKSISSSFLRSSKETKVSGLLARIILALELKGMNEHTPEWASEDRIT